MHNSTLTKLAAWILVTTSFVTLAHAQEDDYDWITWYREQGFGGFVYSVDCYSVGPDGSMIRDEPLPVGAERWLECSTAKSATYMSTSFTNMGAEYCALGQIADFKTGGDDRLTIEVVSQSMTSPWTLRATSATGEALGVSRADGPLGSSMWPAWVDAHYNVINIVPSDPNRSCDNVFNIDL